MKNRTEKKNISIDLSVQQIKQNNKENIYRNKYDFFLGERERKKWANEMAISN